MPSIAFLKEKKTTTIQPLFFSYVIEGVNNGKNKKVAKFIHAQLLNELS